MLQDLDLCLFLSGLSLSVSVILWKVLCFPSLNLKLDSIKIIGWPCYMYSREINHNILLFFSSTKRPRSKDNDNLSVFYELEVWHKWHRGRCCHGGRKHNSSTLLSKLVSQWIYQQWTMFKDRILSSTSDNVKSHQPDFLSHMTVHVAE